MKVVKIDNFEVAGKIIDLDITQWYIVLKFKESVRLRESKTSLKSSEAVEVGIQVGPFLRWVGGKQNLVRELSNLVKRAFLNQNSVYFEPFLGAGSLFFAINPSKSVLSDANEHLMHCYKIVKDSPKTLYRYLQDHKKKTSKTYYYKVRNAFNSEIKKRNSGQNEFTISQAARFIYLNRTCFNGIFRVNEKGYFNVPYATKKDLLLPDFKELANLSRRLKSAQLYTFSYENILNMVKPNDFVYLDPPYPPIKQSSNFNHYTQKRFDDVEHINVGEFARILDELGCKVLISNADTPTVRKTYKKWNKIAFTITRFVSCKSDRKRARELILTNF
ncbi:MAG: DNA adenine methylase [Candidatus Zixiibacteriota bacterium]